MNYKGNVSFFKLHCTGNEDSIDNCLSTQTSTLTCSLSKGAAAVKCFKGNNNYERMI